MANDRKIPKRLYKYREFSNRTLDMLVNDHLYFADPSTFNDPLDTRPSLDIDLDGRELVDLLRKLVERRARFEMRAAAKTIKYRGPRTTNHIKQLSRRRADRLIGQIEYYATDPEYEPETLKQSLLGGYIKDELLRQYDKGVVSLAGRAVCPLMWSHYGDQHRRRLHRLFGAAQGRKSVQSGVRREPSGRSEQGRRHAG